MSYQLVIAEKPSVARSIAGVIGADKKQGGYMEGNGYLVSWCIGHLVSLADAGAYDPRYKKWAYNNRCARICEDVYEQHYGKDLGYGQILGQLAKGKYAAIMAILYAAIVAGGCEMSFEAFDALFSLESIEGMRDLIVQAVEQSLPDAGEQARENPQQVPGTGV